MAQYLVEAYTPKRVRDDLPTLVARARKESTDKRPRSGSERKGNIMRRLLIGASALAVAVAYFVLSALPAFSADNGTVNAQVTVASPCITVSPSTTVDFGTGSFSTFSISGPNYVTLTNTEISFSNCSTQAEKVFVRGTDASGPSGSTAVWSLVDSMPSCGFPEDINQYDLGSVTGSATNNVGKTDSAYTDAGGVVSFAAGSVNATSTSLVMPCAGSASADPMSFQIVFTATF